MGRMQMYMVFIGGWYLYKNYNKTNSADSPEPGVPAADEPPEYSNTDGGEAPTWRRRFTEVDGSWLSYVDAGPRADTQLMLLHRTSWSAETEFDTIIPKLLANAAPSGGLRVLAPDRPCHGYSPCPSGGEPEDASRLFGRLFSSPKQFVFVASGRESARHALAMVHSRRATSHILLVRPLLSAPDAKSLASGADVDEWIRKLLNKDEGTSASLAVDSALWAMKSGGSARKTDRSEEPLDSTKLPRGSSVTLMYLDGDEEDKAFQTEIEDAGGIVDVRTVDSLEDGIVQAVTDILAGEAQTNSEV